MDFYLSCQGAVEVKFFDRLFNNFRDKSNIFIINSEQKTITRHNDKTESVSSVFD